jgi:DNA replication and repair protein RecF
VGAGGHTSPHFIFGRRFFAHDKRLPSERGPPYRLPMSIARLSLSDFRNHADLVIEPGPGFVILTGENGAGKTNILEALSLLSPGRGLRGAALAEMSRQGGTGAFGIAARLDGVELATGTHIESPTRRIARIGGAQKAITALSEWLSIIWLTPAMDRLFNEGASERRRFLDRLVLAANPSHAGHASRYDAAMRQRNRLLSAEEPCDEAWLSGLEHQMTLHGVAVSQARTECLDALSPRLEAAPNGPFARASLTLEGWKSNDDFGGQLARNRVRDAAAGRTLEGPHRTDLAVSHSAKNQPAALCSTGEQKALLLGIILAHADFVKERQRRAPLLLLDEVAAHLDPLRRSYLFDRLAETGGQVWMTGTEASPFAELNPVASHYQFAAGRLT